MFEPHQRIRETVRAIIRLFPIRAPDATARRLRTGRHEDPQPPRLFHRTPRQSRPVPCPPSQPPGDDGCSREPRLLALVGAAGFLPTSELDANVDLAGRPVDV